MTTAVADPTEVIIVGDLPPRQRSNGRFVKVRKEPKPRKTIEELLAQPLPEIDVDSLMADLKAKGLIS